MINTATNIIKGVLKRRPRRKLRFDRISWLQEKLLKHKEDKSLKKIMITGMAISYKRPYELLHSYREIFEREIYCFQSNVSNPLIIDCGSNIGLSVLYFKKLFPGARIEAYEPDENNFKLLKLNVTQNNLQDVVLNQAAVWTTDGEISFSANETEASHISESPSSITVPSISLNGRLQKFPSIDFLKIDIEGAEMRVVKDCRDNLARVKNMFLEYHGKVEDTASLSEILAILNESGFKVYIRNAADLVTHPFRDKRTNTSYDVQLNIFCYR